MAMTARTRYVFLGAGGVLAAGLVGGLVAYLEGGLPAAAAQSRPEQFRYVPADAHLVAFANVGAVMASDLRGRSQERHPNGGEPEFESRTGIRERAFRTYYRGHPPCGSDSCGFASTAGGAARTVSDRGRVDASAELALPVCRCGQERRHPRLGRWFHLPA